MPNESNTAQTTRRVFLGAAAMTAASYNRILGANDRIGMGFIGFGLIGKQHVADFKTFNDVDLVGMCDCYKPRLDEGLAYMGNPNAKGYGDFRKMYENKDIQAVVVATPDHWHALLTIMACAAGKDVYVEKPMTLFIDEGKWMVQAANKYKRIVTAGTQRRQGAGVKAAKKVVEAGTLGKIHTVRWSAFRNIYPGFGKTPVTDPPPGYDYDMWLGPSKKTPYQAHRGLYHFRWFWDFSGGQMTNLGAHQIDQVMYCMDAKGPTLVMSEGGRYALDNDDGDTPDLQDAIWVFPGKNGAPGWTMYAAIREANAGSGGDSMRGQLYTGTKGTMSLAGNYTISSETKSNPVNDIPRFQGHPTGGPVYDQTPREPWLPEFAQSAAAGRGQGRGAGAPPAAGQGRGAGAQGRGAGAGVATDNRYGLTASGVDPTMALNERDWLDCVRSRNKPFCSVEDGHRVAVVCNLANMSLRLHRAIRWDPEKEVVIGDKEAAAACVKPYRAPWDAALRACVKV
ncbi:MAG: Gfo/Idh/MocA family oxidoreductase [Acidobacteriia bacterium]|nr:Gfo/Idh/MocA family oxidoreductase [Terriglobia bacterium]